MRSLLLLFLPAGLFLGLIGLPLESPLGPSRLNQPQSWPIQLWFMAVSGSGALIAGILDWRFHRNCERYVTEVEKSLERQAMSFGIPLFCLLALATVSDEPNRFLVPIVALALWMSWLVAKDEFLFHRKCTPYETCLHRFLVLGNTTAFLSWLHLCFSGGIPHV